MRIYLSEGSVMDINRLGNGDTEVNITCPPKTYNSTEEKLKDKQGIAQEALSALSKKGITNAGPGKHAKRNSVPQLGYFKATQLPEGQIRWDRIPPPFGNINYLPSENNYMVQEGDNLTKIAHDNHISLQELERINPQISNPNFIYSGDVVNLPTKNAINGYSWNPSAMPGMPNYTTQVADQAGLSFADGEVIPAKSFIRPSDFKGSGPTTYVAMLLAQEVSKTENGKYKDDEAPNRDLAGWELNNTLQLPPSFVFSESDNLITDYVFGSGMFGSGFNSALFQRKRADGTYEYVYVTQGTDPGSPADWQNDIDQFNGKYSQQYQESQNNAKILDNLISSFYNDNTRLTFVGHSLGGGEASLNALATGRPAITFNAAALSERTKERYDVKADEVKNEANINAYVVRGDMLSTLQNSKGMQAEGNIYYLEPLTQYLKPKGSEYQDYIFFYRELQRTENHTLNVIQEILEKQIEENDKKSGSEK